MLKIFCDDNDKRAIGHVLKRLKQNYNHESQHIVITPTSYTLGMETLVLDYLDVKGAFNIFIGSFERVCARSLEKVGKSYLSREGAIMVMRKVINANSQKLKHYAGSCKKNTFALDIYRAIESLRLSGYLPESLEESLPKLQSSTQSKLKDIILLYKAYREEIANTTPDLITVYDGFINNIKNEEDIKKSYVYIMGFNTLSNKEIELISVIAENAKETNIALSFVPTDEVNVETTPTQTFTRLRDKLGVEHIELFVRGNFVSREEKIEKINKAKKLTNDLDFLRRELFGYSDKKFKNIKNIEIYAEDNAFSEINAVANEIIKLVRNEKYRYRDITIFNSLAENDFSIKEIFGRYDIPVFVPSRVTLSESLIFDYILSILEFIKNPRDVKKALRFIKNPLFYNDFSEVCQFENYIYEKNITYKDFENSFKGGDFENFRKKVFDILCLFKKQDKNAAGFVNACIRLINDSETKEKFTDLLRGRSSEDFEFNQRSVDLLIDILQEIKEILGKEDMEISEFISILSSGARAQSLSSIPIDLDCVTVAQIGNSKIYENKIAFVMGLTNDSNLDNVSEDRIFTSFDNRSMEENDIAIYPLASEKIKNNRYDFVDMLSKFEKFYFSYPKLSIKGEKTQASIALDELKRLTGDDPDGEYESLLKKYDITSFIDNLFKDVNLENYLVTADNAFFKWLQLQSLIVETKHKDFYIKLLDEIYQYIDKDKRNIIASALECSDSNCHNTVVENLLDYTVKKDQKNRYLSSVSQLETYFACPYKHFMYYGLGASKRSEGFILPITIGTIIHNILENFFKAVKDQIDTIKDQTIAIQIKKSINEIYEDPTIKDLYKNPQNEFFLNRIKDEVEKIIINLIRQIKKGTYRPYKIEFSFGFNSKEAQIEIPIIEDCKGKEKDGVLALRGKIDRIDITKNKNGSNFVGIIDYKTGTKDISIASIFTGQTIQLVVYLQALSKSPEFKNYKPGFIAYLILRDNYLKEEDAQEESSDILKHEGFFNIDANNVYSFNQDIAPSTDDKFYIPEFKINKLKREDASEKTQAQLRKASVSDIYKGYKLDEVEHPETFYNGLSRKILSEKGFEILIKYVEKLIANGFSEIQKGNIEKAPMSMDSCKYCDYKPICDISKDRNERASLDLTSVRCFADI